MCDTFVSLPQATADGSVILGKNSDREPNEAHEIVALPAEEHPGDSVRATYIEIPQAKRTHAVILSRPYWIWGAEMGVNEHGVSIGNEAVFTKAAREPRPGLLGMDLLRLGLERAESAEQAIEVISGLLAQYGQGGQSGHTNPLEYDNSFIVADRNSAWILETVGRDWAASRVTSSASISNGLTLEQADLTSPGLADGPVTAHSDFLYTRFSDSAARQCRTADTLTAQRGRTDVAAAMRLLRDHGRAGYKWSPSRKVTGQTVCAHAGFGPIRVAQSTGSMVSHVTHDDITVWVTGTSAPCTSVFKPVWFGSGLPPLTRPGQMFDPSTLWWRHELLHRTTLRNYPARTAAFTAQREALESRFLAEAAAADDRRRFTADCFAAAQASEHEWLEQVRRIPDGRVPTLHARTWRAWDRQAGMP
jgi:dipeptidase